MACAVMFYKKVTELRVTTGLITHPGPMDGQAIPVWTAVSRLSTGIHLTHGCWSHQRPLGTLVNLTAGANRARSVSCSLPNNPQDSVTPEHAKSPWRG